MAPVFLCVLAGGPDHGRVVRASRGLPSECEGRNLEHALRVGDFEVGIYASEGLREDELLGVLAYALGRAEEDDAAQVERERDFLLAMVRYLAQPGRFDERWPELALKTRVELLGQAAENVREWSQPGAFADAVVDRFVREEAERFERRWLDESPPSA